MFTLSLLTAVDILLSRLCFVDHSFVYEVTYASYNLFCAFVTFINETPDQWSVAVMFVYRAAQKN